LSNIAVAVAAIRKLPKLKWRKTHAEMAKKLEMPIEWLKKMHDQAYTSAEQGHRYKMTKEEMNAQFETHFAKTLLVYERLNKFYK
jgi:hypothetical protein